VSDLYCKLTRDSEDKALMQRMQEGDAAALGILFDRYSRLVFSVAMRILKDRTEAIPSRTCFCTSSGGVASSIPTGER
jgi:hypothetical protein